MNTIIEEMNIPPSTWIPRWYVIAASAVLVYISRFLNQVGSCNEQCHQMAEPQMRDQQKEWDKKNEELRVDRVRTSSVFGAISIWRSTDKWCKQVSGERIKNIITR